LSVLPVGVLVMEIDAVGGWQGGAPPWLDAVFETDVLAAPNVDELPVWDDAEVADLLAAGLVRSCRRSPRRRWRSCWSR
jgi:hypothetical protein